MTATAKAGDVARAPSELTIEVFTSPGRPIVSALPPPPAWQGLTGYRHLRMPRHADLAVADLASI